MRFTLKEGKNIKGQNVSTTPIHCFLLPLSGETLTKGSFNWVTATSASGSFNCRKIFLQLYINERRRMRSVNDYMWVCISQDRAILSLSKFSSQRERNQFTDQVMKFCKVNRSVLLGHLFCVTNNSSLFSAALQVQDFLQSSHKCSGRGLLLLVYLCIIFPYYLTFHTIRYNYWKLLILHGVMTKNWSSSKTKSQIFFSTEAGNEVFIILS